MRERSCFANKLTADSATSNVDSAFSAESSLSLSLSLSLSGNRIGTSSILYPT
ncbi:MAG: hypothetical protein LBQ02_02700 [Candidatus Nomurabacteria bacterium]|nr:hypothetical protein [Candidatus Nomurabacteria bacterium]